MNPKLLALNIHGIEPVGGLQMGLPGEEDVKLPKPMAIGLKGPWHINPGSPNFPNHRPYLSNPKAPNLSAPVVSQQPKTT
jgi:hypothetical protein